MRVVLVSGLAVVNELGDVIGDSVLVEDGLIRGIGPKSRFTGSYSVEYTFDGYIIPSIVDAHLHIRGVGLSLWGLDLRGVSSIEELKALVRSSKTPLVYGRGWDQELFKESRWPTRWDVDEVAGDRPVVLVRVCGHVALLNTKALELTKPWERYPELVDMKGGAPTGLVFEDAVAYVMEKLLSTINLKPLMITALEKLSKAGIAGVSTMSCSEVELRVLEELAREAGGLPVKVSCYPDYAMRDVVRGGVSGWVEVAGFKLYSDGSLGARTAYLREPYSDEPSSRGLLLAGRRLVGEALLESQRRGLRLAVHAIGDAALDEVIEAAITTGVSGFRVEHASVAWDEQIDLLRELNAYVVVQPRFRVSDWWIDKRLGSRFKLAYRFKTMVNRGVKLALSSDAPVEPFDPNETIRAAMSKCEQPACLRDEALSIREILKAYTRIAAEASGGPLSRSGVMERGFSADFTITKLNPVWDEALKPLEVVVSGFRASDILKYLLQA